LYNEKEEKYQYYKTENKNNYCRGIEKRNKSKLKITDVKKIIAYQ
jgi:hypothetical protein